VEVSNLTLGSSERADVIIDFRGYEGRSFILTNLAAAPFLTGEVTESMKEILEFRVASSGTHRCRQLHLDRLAIWIGLD
jgi:hypothetical protein